MVIELDTVIVLQSNNTHCCEKHVKYGHPEGERERERYASGQV